MVRTCTDGGLCNADEWPWLKHSRAVQRDVREEHVDLHQHPHPQ